MQASVGKSFKRLLSISEVAELCGVSGSTVRRLIRRGQLRALRVGGQIRIERRDLDRFFAASRLEHDRSTAAGG